MPMYPICNNSTFNEFFFHKLKLSCKRTIKSWYAHFQLLYQWLCFMMLNTQFALFSMCQESCLCISEMLSWKSHRKQLCEEACKFFWNSENWFFALMWVAAVNDISCLNRCTVKLVQYSCNSCHRVNGVSEEKIKMYILHKVKSTTFYYSSFSPIFLNSSFTHSGSKLLIRDPLV